VSERLGFRLLDSGALYRLTALSAMRAGVDMADEAGLASLARAMDVRFADGAIYLEGADVSTQLRAEEIGNNASRVAALPAVRTALLDLQLAFRAMPGLVGDGRDMGTVVFPDAKLKVFLTASVEARAQRRYKQLIEKGFPANLSDLLKDLIERDARDTNRAVAPLKPAEGAHLLDTSNMSVDEAVEQVLAWYSGLPA
jgi:cytidylate kinase